MITIILYILQLVYIDYNYFIYITIILLRPRDYSDLTSCPRHICVLVHEWFIWLYKWFKNFRKPEL